MSELKLQLIDCIFDNINMNKYKFSTINTLDDIKLFIDDLDTFSFNIRGYNCFLCFFRIGHNNHTFLIQRDNNKFAYDKNKIDINKVKLEFKKLQINNNSIFNGTILTGISTKKDNVCDFVISDVYLFEGNDISNISISDKLKNIQVYLNKYYKCNPKNNINLFVDNLYNICDLPNIIKNILPKKIEKHNIRGLIFHQKYSGYRKLFMFNDDDIKYIYNTDYDIINIINNFDENNNLNNKKINYDITKNDNDITYKIHNKYINKNIYTNMEIKKTNKTDIYKLYLTEKHIVNKKKIYKKVYMGYSLVQTLNMSMYLRKLFNDNNNDTKIFVKCKFDNNKQKWCPIKKIDKDIKLPSDIKEVKKYMDIEF